jgi:hypothetical protein
MALFKKPVPACAMCGKTAAEGCGNDYRHVEQISSSGPAWLPAPYRGPGIGQFTWRCTRCNSFPAMKWPSEHGARAGMMLHLGNRHGTGDFGLGAPVNFEMRELG